MRILRYMNAALVGLLILPSVAVAHPGHEHEIGAVHVLLSFNHVLTFLGIGAAAGAIMLFRHPVAVIVANGVLAFLLLMQGVAHAAEGGTLFGVEVAVAGAILAMGAWRAAYLFYAQFMARRVAARATRRLAAKRSVFD